MGGNGAGGFGSRGEGRKEGGGCAEIRAATGIDGEWGTTRFWRAVDQQGKEDCLKAEAGMIGLTDQTRAAQPLCFLFRVYQFFFFFFCWTARHTRNPGLALPRVEWRSTGSALEKYGLYSSCAAATWNLAMFLLLEASSGALEATGWMFQLWRTPIAK